MEAEDKSIFVLNDYCMFHILSYMNIKELINLELVCKRFNDLVKRTYKSYQELDFVKIFSQCYEGTFVASKLMLADAIRISRRVGPFVHTLRASRPVFALLEDNCDFLFEVISHCNNLQCVYLNGFPFLDFNNFNTTRMGILSRAFTTLKVAHLINCNLTDETGISLLNAVQLESLNLSENVQLECLNLSENEDMTGLCLVVTLKGLKEIILTYCAGIQPQFFRQFCAANPQLESLNICYCHSFDESCLPAIVDNFKNLTKLEICNTCGGDYDILGSIPSLTHLCISYEPFMEPNKTTMFLTKVAQHDRLEFLDLTRCNIDENILDQVLGSFTKLKVLKLEHCWNCKDSTLASLSCTLTLEELHVTNCKITPSGLKELIMRCTSLKFIDLTKCYRFGWKFLISIEPALSKRSHILELEVAHTNISLDLNDPSNNILKDFIVKNQGKIKITHKNVKWTEEDRYVESESEEENEEN